MVTSWGESCPYTLRVINADDSADVRPSIYGQVKDVSPVAIVDPNTKFERQYQQKEVALTVSSGLEAAMGVWNATVELIATAEGAQPKRAPNNFTVTIQCDPANSAYPMSPSGSKCPNAGIDWCGLNYKEDRAGSRCPAFDPCTTGGDGGATADEFGNACPDQTSQCSGTDGWAFDKDGQACPQFDRCTNNWATRADGSACPTTNYKRCEAGGEGGRVFSDAAQTTFCPTQYYAACLGQDVRIPLGYFADKLLAAEGRLGRNSNKFHRIVVNGGEEKIALLDFATFAEYPDLSVRKAQSEDGKVRYSADNGKGYISFPAEQRFFNRLSIEFAYCDVSAWSTGQTAAEEAANCGTPQTLDFKLTEVCNLAGGAQWNGLTEYRYDQKSSADSYSLKLASVLSDSSISKQIPEMQSFYRANYPSSTGLDFSKGAADVEVSFQRYTPVDTGATPLTLNDTYVKFQGFGFDRAQWTHITDKSASSGLFQLDATKEGIVFTPNYTCTDAANQPSRCSVPAGYYEAEVKLTSKACIDADYCAYDIVLLKRPLYFYVCQDCNEWKLVIEEPVTTTTVTTTTTNTTTTVVE